MESDDAIKTINTIVLKLQNANQLVHESVHFHKENIAKEMNNMTLTMDKQYLIFKKINNEVNCHSWKITTIPAFYFHINQNSIQKLI